MLSNKTILVTGASSGIGSSLAKHLSNQDAHLVITGRNSERLKETYQALHDNGHTSVTADLLKIGDIDKLIAELPVLNGVVFNAGVVEYNPVKFLSAEKIDSIFDVNFKSNVLLTQKLLKNKKIAKGGSLVYVSSISAKLGVPGTALYAASKAALIAFAKVVASEVANHGIRSNCICPGIIKTPMTSVANEVASGDEMKDAENAYPLGFGAPRDIEGIVTFLLSDTSGWITGSDIIIDGGFTLK